MKVRDIMKHEVVTCPLDSSLADAARLMWDRDLGALPVVDPYGRAIGMITDRDICMAALHSGVDLKHRGVIVAMSKGVYSCHPDSSVEVAEEIMQRCQIRRLPVIDGNDVLAGIVTLADIASHARALEEPAANAAGVVRTIAGIVERRWKGALAQP
ncbi:MAG: CBS domain-containing protein [Polyangiaceae bacterium]